MIAATIDIGTNTTLALLAEQERGELKILRDQQTPNRLGAALDGDDALSPEAIALNVDLLGEILRDFRRAGADGFTACATSVLRRARNRDEFISAVRDVLNLDVEILSGTKEASLTFAGAVSALDLLPHEQIGVVDLGGGSTEIIEGRGNVPGQFSSLDTGAVYLTKQYFADDIPTTVQITALREDARRQLGGLLESLRDGSYPWLLVGGTAVTLAILKLKLHRFIPEQIGGTSLTRTNINDMIDNFTGKHPDELQRLPGIPLGRGRYIFAGALLLSEVYGALDIQEAKVTERGLRHGLWLDRFGERRTG